MIIYYGLPGSFAVRFGDNENNDPPQELPRRDDLAQADIPFGWGHVKVGDKFTAAMVAGAAPLALALCAHALSDDIRAVALYQRFKMRAMDKWKPDEPWAVSIEDVAAACDAIEADAVSTEAERLKVSRERPPIESEIGGQSFGFGGPIWDTDDKGRQIDNGEK